MSMLPRRASGSRRRAGFARPLEMDPAPVLRAIVEVFRGTPAAIVSARFHAAVARVVLDAARPM
jgi:hydrogenase maturation protein HypF